MTPTVVLARPPATGGLHAHMRHEARLLAALGAAVIDAGPSAGRIEGATWHEVPISEGAHPVKAARSILRLRSLLRSLSAGEDGGRGPVTVHAHGVRAGALACLAARLLGAPRRSGQSQRPGISRRPRVLVTVHNRMPTSGAGKIVGALLMRIVARGADTVLVVSPDLGDAARAAGARTVIRALVPAPTASGTADLGTPGPTDDGVSALVLARLAPQKGLDVLLDAVGLLRERAADNDGARPFHVLVAGDGPLREHLSARIRSEDLPVTLLGHVSDPAPLLASADLVIQPSLWEGQPVAIQEALQAGRPIIATDAGGTRWVCEDAALLVPPHDPDALAAAMRDLTGPTGAEKRQRLSVLARERARRLPTEHDLAAQLTTLIPGLDPPPPPTTARPTAP
ncbi:MAG: glycosyltransferase [Dermabacter sp.]|nr:glycosyltransferase [Dermabacter sp.]